jgi:hypothetical protein
LQPTSCCPLCLLRVQITVCFIDSALLCPAFQQCNQLFASIYGILSGETTADCLLRSTLSGDTTADSTVSETIANSAMLRSILTSRTRLPLTICRAPLYLVVLDYLLRYILTGETIHLLQPTIHWASLHYCLASLKPTTYWALLYLMVLHYSRLSNALSSTVV